MTVVMGAAAATTKLPRNSAGFVTFLANCFASVSDGSLFLCKGGGASENLSRRSRAAPVNAVTIHTGTQRMPTTATPMKALRQPSADASMTASDGQTADPSEFPM